MFTLFLSLALAAATLVSSTCTSEQRLAGAELVIRAYNNKIPGMTALEFGMLPLEWDCHTDINPDGGPAVPVAIDAITTRIIAISTRQLFSEVTGEYTDYDNGTTIIHTNVTLGVRNNIPIPVTFYADVHLDYNLDTCLMYEIQAYAVLPTEVAGIMIEPSLLSMLLSFAAPKGNNGKLLGGIL